MAVAAPVDLIPFHRPSIGEDEIAAAVAVMRSGWLTTGKICQQFEEQFAAYLGAKHAVSVNSATAALHLALEAFGVGPGDEVVVPTYTFTACGEVVAYQGSKLVLADVGEDYLLGPSQLADVATLNTRVVMPVHFAGQVVDLEPLRQVVPAVFIEDAAHALPIAKITGEAAAFSFYATKTMTTGGEGGMLVTDSDDIAARARIMRLHGISADAWNRYGPGNRWDYEVIEAGFKYNLTDLAAAIGLVQLGRLQEMRGKRAKIAAAYNAAFTDFADFTEGAIRVPSNAEGHAWHLYVIRVDPQIRDRVITHLSEQGIGASVHFIPLHLHPYYQRLGYRPGDFPVAERLYSESISLPIWPDMSDEQVDRVASTVLEVCQVAA